MAKINAVVQSRLETSTNAIIPGSIVAKDIADGTITKDKIACKWYTYTMLVNLYPKPITVDTLSHESVGYIPANEIGVLVVPLSESYLKRIDIAATVTTDSGSSGFPSFALNFKNSIGGPHLLPNPGLEVDANTSDPHNSIEFGDTDYPYNVNQTIFIDLIQALAETRGISVAFTFRHELLT